MNPHCRYESSCCVSTTEVVCTLMLRIIDVINVSTPFGANTRTDIITVRILYSFHVVLCLRYFFTKMNVHTSGQDMVSLTRFLSRSKHYMHQWRRSNIVEVRR